MTALASGPVQDALGDVARFIPKLILFLIVLVLGWLAARLLRAGVSRLLRRVGFDQAVERGGVGRLLSRTRYDARGVLTTLVYYAVLLFTLQLAFGIWGPNPVSALIAGIVAWLPRAFVAIVIVVVAAAVAAGVRNVITSALQGLSYGRLLARVAGAFIIAIGIIAALDQIGVATSVTTPVLVAILATIGGILVVGVGGGLVRPMQSRWESWLSRAELELPQVRDQLRVAAEQREAEARAAAEREEAARLEDERGEAERLEAERAEAARREQEAREAAEAEARAAEFEREQEAERVREAERLQAARDEAARDEAARLEAEREAAEREEAVRQDGARAEAARQEVALREAAQTQAAREEAAREEAAREEAARQEAVQAQAAREEAAREEAKPAKTRTSRPRTARERAEQAAEHRAAAEAGTLPQAPPSDEPTVAIPISKIRRAAAGSGQDAEQTQPITVPVTDAADDSERTQVLPTMPEPEQKAPPSTPRRRRPPNGGASK
ncbi:MAG: hypothetical protein JWP76_1353 [Dactylosporangium sp.]|nr:hypothetical protein [Dactylosporangium sp.]